MISFAGVNAEAKGKMSRVFVLIHEGSCHTIIFAHVLRHDLDLDSVVLDTCVVPLTYARLFDLHDSLSELSQREICRIIFSKRESILWKRLIATWWSDAGPGPTRKAASIKEGRS